MCCFGGLKHALPFDTPFIGFACELINYVHHLATKCLDSLASRSQIENGVSALTLQWFGSVFAGEKAPTPAPGPSPQLRAIYCGVPSPINSKSIFSYPSHPTIAPPEMLFWVSPWGNQGSILDRLDPVELGIFVGPSRRDYISSAGKSVVPPHASTPE